MIAHPKHEHVPPEWRPIFLTDDKNHVFARQRMRSAACNEKLVIEDSVVLVGNLLEDDVLILGSRHHHQVLQRVVEIATIVHMNMSGAVMPAFHRHIGHPLQADLRSRHLVGHDIDVDTLRPHLEAFDGRQRRLSDWQLDAEFASRMKHSVACRAYTRVRVCRRVELAVGRCDMDSCAGHLPAVVDGPD